MDLPPRSSAPLSQQRFELILVALGVGAGLMGGTWAWRGNHEAMAMALVLAVIVGALWLLSRRGRSRLSAVLVGLALNVVTLLGVSYFGGPRAHAPAFLLVVVMCSGLMVGWRGGALSLAACTLYVALDGWYGPPPWATGAIATEPDQVTMDWLLAIGLAGSLAVVAFHTAGQRIEEAQRSEAEKRRALEHARAANQAKSAFLANMSHELRTPLTAILGYSELLSDELDDEGGQDAERITQAGRHLLELIDQVLDMSRVEAGKLDLEWAEVDVTGLLSEVVDLVQPQARRRACELQHDFADLGVVEGDALRIRQILQNLLSNAIKYAPGVIELSGRRGGDGVVLTVRDHGSGIPSSVLPTLFEPFSRGHGADHQGTGLGLALASSLASQMGGTLSVESSDRGSAFTLRLPARRGNASDAAAG